MLPLKLRRYVIQGNLSRLAGIGYLTRSRLNSIIFIFIYLFISQTQIYTTINTSYKLKQKYVCRSPEENQNMSCRQAPLNIDIMSIKNFWSLLYDPPAENMHYRGHCYLDLKLVIIISSCYGRNIYVNLFRLIVCLVL